MENDSVMKMDLATAKWFRENYDNDDAFPVKFSECEKCGAIYIPSIAHDCKMVVEVPVHDVFGSKVMVEL